MTLTANALNALTSQITGKPAGRVASRDAAEGRFIREAKKAGIDGHAILAHGSAYDCAKALQNQTSGTQFGSERVIKSEIIQQVAEQVSSLPAEVEEDEISAAAEAAAAARDARILEAAATSRSPGLARLRAHPKAQEIREKTQEEAASVLSGVYPFEKGRNRKAALALVEAAAPAPAPKPQKVRAAKPKAEKVKPEGRAVRVSASDAEVITAVVANPKKPGSRAHARFALYSAGQTVAAFIQACVNAGYPEREARADLSWDRRKGFISLGAEAAAAA